MTSTFQPSMPPLQTLVLVEIDRPDRPSDAGSHPVEHIRFRNAIEKFDDIHQPGEQSPESEAALSKWSTTARSAITRVKTRGLLTMHTSEFDLLGLYDNTSLSKQRHLRSDILSRQCGDEESVNLSCSLQLITATLPRTDPLPMTFFQANTPLPGRWTALGLRQRD